MLPLSDDRRETRTDLAWAISVGGIGVVAFASLLLFTWTFATALGSIALTNLLGRMFNAPHWLRLSIVCLVLVGLLAGIVFLGGTTIAQQATALSGTIKNQLVDVKAFLERNGIDTSYFELANPGSAATPSSSSNTQLPTHNFPSAGEIASGGGKLVSQTLKLLLGTLSAVGNFFIVLFLGLTFAAQPSLYRKGLIYLSPAKHRASATVIIDRISETLERWLVAQIVVMAAVFAVTWLGLAVIGIQGSFILGIQAGLLAFIPTVGAIVAGLIVVLASLASGWVAAASALVLFLGVHALESYILTPILQRQALDIPPATLFAFQILLGIVFGIWGISLALPLMAIVKVFIDYFKGDESRSASVPA